MEICINIIANTISIFLTALFFWIAYKILVPLVFASYFMPTYLQCVVAIFLFNLFCGNMLDNWILERYEAENECRNS
jgi:hypothetical protein